jgi:hypothetical protein
MAPVIVLLPAPAPPRMLVTELPIGSAWAEALPVTAAAMAPEVMIEPSTSAATTSAVLAGARRVFTGPNEVHR